jgi:ribose transport system substrate-binding protein
MIRYALSAVLVAVLSMGISGCGEEASESSGGGEAAGLKLAVIGKSTVNDYWKAVEAGARKAAKEQDVKIIWTGPDAETNHTQQGNMVDNMVSLGVDGIVIAPTNFTALKRPIESAVDRGVPVVLIDSTLDSAKPLSMVATDNRAGGVRSAEALVAAVGENKPFGGKVVMLRFLEGSGSTEEREAGFEETAKAAGLDVVESRYTKGSGSTTDAADTADALLRRHIKGNVLELDGIFASNQPTAIGMLRKLEQFKAAGVQINCPFVGFDAHDVLLQAVRDGAVAGLVVQDPVNMGYLGVKTMVDHLKGKPVESFVNTGVTLVTKDNIDDPDVKVLTLQK